MDWTFSKTEDKENQSKIDYICDISSSNILNLSQSMNTSGLLSTNLISANDSFDCDKIKLDAYEKSIQKLAAENRSLRKRVKKLTELARSKENQLIEAINEACEDKKKNEEKSLNEYNAHLQSYYECFLQIEKENDALKLKIEQMRDKLNEQQIQLDSLTNQQQQQLQLQQQQQANKSDCNFKVEDAEPKAANATAAESMMRKQFSLELDEILGPGNAANTTNTPITINSTNNNQTDGSLFEETSTQTAAVAVDDDNLILKNDFEQQKLRIDELILEKNALEKKLNGIESSLARWIFRACDYKCDLDKHEENVQNLTAKTTDLTTQNENLLVDKKNLLAQNESLLKDKENLNDKVKSLEVTLEDLNNLLEVKNNELKTLKETNTKLESTNEEITNKLKLIEEKVFVDFEMQTEMIEAPKQVENVEPETTSMPAPPPPPPPQPSLTQANMFITSTPKLNVSAVVTNTGHVAKTAAKFNSKLLKPVETPAIGATNVTTTTANPGQIDHLSNELKSIKLKMDGLILEKSSLKFKNDELNRDIAELNKQIDLIKQNASSSSLSSSSKNPKPTQSTMDQFVQTIRVHLVTSHTQTSDSHVVKHQNQDQILIKNNENNLRIEIESYKMELEHLRMNCTKEMDDLKKSLSKEIENLTNLNLKLEQRIEQDKKEILKLSQLNSETSQQVSLRNEKIQGLEDLMKQLTNDYRKEKQISGTIIQQQKKLLYFLQMKLNPDQYTEMGAVPGTAAASSGHHNPLSNKLFKKHKQQNNNPLLAHLHKPTVPYQFSNNNNGNQLAANNPLSKPIVNTISNNNNKGESGGGAGRRDSGSIKYEVKKIEAELNSSYQALNELNQMRKPTENSLSKAMVGQLNSQNSTRKPTRPKQIHVFITGLNTCPVYCHVCQHLIPLIAYASKCQICSFTCHSTCSNTTKTKSGSTANKNGDELNSLKYCHVNYMKISQYYNNFINKLSASCSNINDKSQTSLIADYLNIFVDNKWKKYWLVLRIDAHLELYQTKTNLKPFDSINLISEKCQFESESKLIKKLLATHSTTANQSSSHKENIDDVTNHYETVEPISFNFEGLTILLFNSKFCLQIGFDSFIKKNIWYDALQSSYLIGYSMHQPILSTSVSSSSTGKKQSSQTTLTSTSSTSIDLNQFKCLNLEKVLKPFLELCDTIVNSYCFISEKLIALACDDGLYAMNSIENQTEQASSNISLIKINSIESAHKLYYQSEFGKLCLIGRKSRQFLSIDFNELLAATLNPNLNEPNDNENNAENNDDDDEESGESRSVSVKIEHIQNIDRCHLFECSYNRNVGYWYLAVATPETIYILLFNKATSKYTLIKTISTQSDSPCLCLKFSQLTSQLIFGCSKDFFKMDMTYLQTTSFMESLGKKSNDEEAGFNKIKQPIGVCVINVKDCNDHEAVLLCYEDHALIVTYNSASNWCLQQATFKKSSSSSISQYSNNFTCLKWPKGLPPLQIEYDSGSLYLFYNDSIVVYNISYDANESSFVFRKFGVAFIYKPRFLSALNASNANYLIISNRRPTNSNTADLANENGADNNYDNIKTGMNNFECDDDEDFDTESDATNDDETKSAKINHLEEDRICLSYFSPSHA